MKELIDTLVQHAGDYWVKIATAAAFMLIGWFFGKRRAKANWAKKEFLDRLNVSLNVIENGKLLIRTILEKRCDDVFLNSVAAETVVQASRRRADPARHGSARAEDGVFALPHE